MLSRLEFFNYSTHEPAAACPLCQEEGNNTRYVGYARNFKIFISNNEINKLEI
jgi:hypothetical protein